RRDERQQQRPRASVAATTTTDAPSPTVEGGIAFPEIPDFQGFALGEETESTSPDSVSTEDFARCDAAPTALTNEGSRRWVTYSGDRGVSFRHPANWDAFEEGEQSAATSPDGSRAFVVDVVATDGLTVSFSELFTTMASLRPGLEYSDPRSILIDGKHGCAVKLEGDGHSGRIVVLPFDAGIAVLTVGHELDPPTSAVEDGWAMLASFRIDASR
ncbi:MAG: hypothetical protein Q8K63_10670, partial [Acidimicrobiales bacterium]|nr:hypothetical protein [Acidimicrobiales bacterium]